MLAASGCPFAERTSNDPGSAASAGQCPFAPSSGDPSAALARDGEGRGADGSLLSAQAQLENLWKEIVASAEGREAGRRTEWPGPRAVYKTLMGEEANYDALLRSRADWRPEGEPPKVCRPAACDVWRVRCVWRVCAACVQRVSSV